MNTDQIEAFLAVVDIGSINLAAKKLFITQSTLSTRIKKLEESVGVKLLEREKGYKSIELTPYGQEFLKYAKQFMVLKEEVDQIKNINSFKELKIASVDAVNNFTFVELYKKFMKENKNIKLHIKTHHSDEIHGLVSSGEADLGLVYSEIKYHDVHSEPIFRELNYLICHKDSKYYDGISPEDLDPTEEVYINWSQDFYQWHYRFFGDIKNKHITVNTGNMLSHYLDIPGNWAIAPMSVIESFKKTADIVYYKLSTPPPPRFCYLLINRNEKLNKKELIEKFKKYMVDFIESDSSICTFHTWMIEE